MIAIVKCPNIIFKHSNMNVFLEGPRFGEDGKGWVDSVQSAPWPRGKDLWVSATATLKLRNIKALPELCRQECEAAQLRLSGNSFKVGEADDFEDWEVTLHSGTCGQL